MTAQTAEYAFAEAGALLTQEREMLIGSTLAKLRGIEQLECKRCWTKEDRAEAADLLDWFERPALKSLGDSFSSLEMACEYLDLDYARCNESLKEAARALNRQSGRIPFPWRQENGQPYRRPIADMTADEAAAYLHCDRWRIHKFHRLGLIPGVYSRNHRGQLRMLYRQADLDRFAAANPNRRGRPRLENCP